MKRTKYKSLPIICYVTVLTITFFMCKYRAIAHVILLLKILRSLPFLKAALYNIF